MGERQAAKHHSCLASQASLSGWKESTSSVPGLGILRLHARSRRRTLRHFGKAAVLLPQLCFIAAVVLFRSVF